MQIDPTQAAGIAALVPATLATFAVSVGRSRPRRFARGSWAAIAAIHAVLAVEVVMKTRYRFHNVVDARLVTAGIYPERRPAQIALLLTVLILAVLTLPRLARRGLAPHLALARCATAALVSVFLIETISLHEIDAIIYGSLGPVPVIGWLWLSCGVTTTAAAVANLLKG